MRGESGLEDLLKSLFALQRFAENPELQRVIDEVHARYTRRGLSMEDLEYVSAAGTPAATNKYGTESRR